MITVRHVTKKNVLWGCLVLALISVGLCLHLPGKWKLRQQFNEMLSIPFPKDGTLLHTSQEILTNRHSCLYFTGSHFSTTNSYHEILLHYNRINRQYDLAEIAWIGGDSIVIHYRNLGNNESDFGSSRYRSPLQMTPYGANVGAEINTLLSLIKFENINLNYFVFFTVREVKNPFVYHCYFGAFTL